MGGVPILSPSQPVTKAKLTRSMAPLASMAVVSIISNNVMLCIEAGVDVTAGYFIRPWLLV